MAATALLRFACRPSLAAARQQASIAPPFTTALASASTASRSVSSFASIQHGVFTQASRSSTAARQYTALCSLQLGSQPRAGVQHKTAGSFLAAPTSSSCKIPTRLYAAQELQTAAKSVTESADDSAEVEYSEGTKFASEFIVTGLFNFLSCTAVSTAQQMSAGNALTQTFMIMGAHAVILPMLIFAFMPISGAHFNPMVTFSMVAAGRQSPQSGLGYAVAQCLGGILGAAAAFATLPSALQNIAHSGVQAVPADHTVLQAFAGETLASCFFLFVLFGTLVDKRGWGKAGPWAVPLAILLLMWLVGPISSMCINPARALGPAVVSGFWDNHWIWWTAPFLGGGSAAITYTKLFLPAAQKLKKA